MPGTAGELTAITQTHSWFQEVGPQRKGKEWKERNEGRERGNEEVDTEGGREGWERNGWRMVKRVELHHYAKFR